MYSVLCVKKKEWMNRMRWVWLLKILVEKVKRVISMDLGETEWKKEFFKREGRDLNEF